MDSIKLLTAMGLSVDEAGALAKYHRHDGYSACFLKQYLRVAELVIFMFEFSRSSSVDGSAYWHGLGVLKDGRVTDASWLALDYHGGGMKAGPWITSLAGAQIMGDRVSVTFKTAHGTETREIAFA